MIWYNDNFFSHYRGSCYKHSPQKLRVYLKITHRFRSWNFNPMWWFKTLCKNWEFCEIRLLTLAMRGLLSCWSCICTRLFFLDRRALEGLPQTRPPCVRSDASVTGSATVPESDYVSNMRMNHVPKMWFEPSEAYTDTYKLIGISVAWAIQGFHYSESWNTMFMPPPKYGNHKIKQPISDDQHFEMNDWVHRYIYQFENNVYIQWVLVHRDNY